MACPYFEPVSPNGDLTNSQHAMLPLGDLWAGVCRAQQDQPSEPEPDMLMRSCNMGYAAGSCHRFPGSDSPDAVRFAIRHDTNRSIGVYFVVERDHQPCVCGPLEYSRSEGAFSGPMPNGTLGRQAQAYIESYLRRKEEASGRP
jgi:hypothetical protein